MVRKKIERATDPYLGRLIAEPSFFAKDVLGVDLFDKQRLVCDCADRFIVFRAGRKFGKTWTIAIKALHWALFAPYLDLRGDKAFIQILAPTQKQAQIMFETIRSFAEANPWILGEIKRSTQTEIDFKNGSIISTLATGQEGRTARGFRPNIIIFDEAAHVREQVYNVVLFGGFGLKPRVLLVSTPFGKTGFFYNACADKKQWVEFHATSLENPYVEQDIEFFSLMKDRATPDEWKQEVLAEFVEEGDALIPIDLIKRAVAKWEQEVVDPVTYDVRLPESCKYMLGVDVATSGRDSTVYTRYAVDAGGSVYVLDCREKAQTTLTEIENDIKELYIDHYYETPEKITRIYIDANALGWGLYEMVDRNPAIKKRVFGIYPVKASKKKKPELYVKIMRPLFERGKMAINAVATGRLRYQLSYMKKELTKEKTIKIVSEEHDDYPDSLAVGMEALTKEGQMSYIPGMAEQFDEAFGVKSNSWLRMQHGDRLFR